jgi:hypothetical protein
VACNDGDACTASDACAAGTCKGTPVVCDDHNPCTTDACDKVLGKCVSAPNTLACDDGNACTEGDVCASSACAGKPKVCNDNNPATQDSCDPKSGCVYTPVPPCVPATCGGYCIAGKCVPPALPGVCQDFALEVKGKPVNQTYMVWYGPVPGAAPMRSGTFNDGVHWSSPAGLGECSAVVFGFDSCVVHTMYGSCPCAPMPAGGGVGGWTNACKGAAVPN